jgi:hypothetical protein
MIYNEEHKENGSIVPVVYSEVEKREQELAHVLVNYYFFLVFSSKVNI